MLRQFCESRIKSLQAEPPTHGKPTIFDTALADGSDKWGRSRDLHALSADGIVFFAAGMPSDLLSAHRPNAYLACFSGTDTTSHTLVTGTWHLLRNPDMLNILRQELKSKIPDVRAGVTLNWMKLEQLSYLVRHSLRVFLIIKVSWC